jgi:hypothetical protein
METADKPKPEYELSFLGHALVVIEMRAGEENPAIHQFRYPLDAIEFYESHAGPLAAEKRREFERRATVWIG